MDERTTQKRTVMQPSLRTGAVRFIAPVADPHTLVWLKSRGISKETAEFFSVGSGEAWYHSLKRDSPSVAFPYIVNGKIMGHKLRSIEEKANVCDKPLTSLCGAQCIDLSENHIVICEGEMDMLSLHEAGIMNATSVPNGAASLPKDATDKKTSYGFLWPSKDDIDKAERIYIAADADEPGQALAEELARRIGRHKCWKIFYPDDCKDSNDVLMKHGADMLKGCFDSAEAWPVSGLYEASTFFGEVRDLFNGGYAKKVQTGMAPVDDIYSVAKGMLTIVTGIPAAGKTTFVDQIMINAARLHGHVFAICSFENPPHVHIAKIAEMLLQKHFFESDLPGERMTEDELDNVLPFIHRHFKFLYQDDAAKADMASIIERIRTAVFRWGVNGAVIDPYNYINRPKEAESETQWIDDILTRVRLLAQASDLHIWFVAHPTKLVADASGVYPPPRGYSISGSAAWFAKADFGLTIHKDTEHEGTVRIINWKTRWHWLGKEGETSILYDNVRHCYLSSALDDLPPYKENESL